MNYFNTQSGSSIVATASVGISCGEQEISEAATGNGPVDIVVEHQGRKFHGMGLETDIVGSSANAMIHVINSIWRSEQVEIEKRKQQTTQEAI